MQELTYYPVNKLIGNLTDKIDILEVGCGYGYLTYALNKKAIRHVELTFLMQQSILQIRILDRIIPLPNLKILNQIKNLTLLSQLN